MIKTFAVDFDGTCVDHQYPFVGDDVPGAVDTLKEIASNGDRIILNTMRSDNFYPSQPRIHCAKRGFFGHFA